MFGRSVSPVAALSFTLLTVTVMLGACSYPGEYLYCDETHPCGERAVSEGRTVCDLTGDLNPQDSGGHGRTCVHPPDASLPDDAASDAFDAGDGPEVDGGYLPDGTPADGPAPDAIMVSPPVTTFQSADLVVGQMSFAITTADSGGESSRALDAPHGVATDGTRLSVADGDNARALQFSSLPVVSFASASFVLGQSSFTSHSAGATQAVTQAGFNRAYSDGTHVVVADFTNNRVLVWVGAPTSNGENADLVLGQASFTSTSPGKGASQMKWPSGVWSDGARLVVADRGNSRVLVWTSFPVANGEPADVVLGWPDFGMGDGDSVMDPPAASSMKDPHDVFCDGTRLFVADTGNNRVMIWNTFPTGNNAPAAVFVGQGGATSNLPQAGGAGINDVGLRSPQGVLVTRGSLFVADTLNHRVVVHAPVPGADGEPADVVLGQTDLVTDTYAFGSPSATRLSGPRGLAAAADKLFVADPDWNRVLRFDLAP